MFYWLFIIILAYLFFSIASLGDKLVLNRAQSPKLYTFYVGVLSVLVVVFLPFVGLSIPNVISFFWIISTSLVLIGGLYVLYSAVDRFEVSKVVPLVGVFQPILILLLGWVFFISESFNISDLLAFFILIVAGIIVSFDKKPDLTKSLLKLSLFASLFMALSFIFMKMVFLSQSFLHGIIWIGIFNFIFALTFLFDKSFRGEIFVKKSAFDKKTLSLVVLTQSAGGVAGILQNLAIYLVPASSLAVINALRGVQYAFLFVLTLIFSKFLPKILREEVSKRIIIQKSVAILLIPIGLAILVL